MKNYKINSSFVSPDEPKAGLLLNLFQQTRFSDFSSVNKNLTFFGPLFVSLYEKNLFLTKENSNQ